MKRFLTVFASIFVAGILLVSAQAPQMFNYQGVARDAAGDALINQSIGIQASILQGSSTGLSVYSEEHAVTTNAFGVFSLAVGNGTSPSGTFSAIDWASGPYYLNVEMDATGGTAYVQMGVAQLLSVPYALYANSGIGSQGPTGPIGPMGPAGVAGANGMNGANGLNGAAGATGPAGPSGPAGPTGATGDIGQIGPTGATGPTGEGLPTGTEGQTLIHNGTEWVASNKIKCDTPSEKVEIEGEGIRIHPPIPLPPVGEQDEAELEREFLRFKDDLDRALEFLKTATGGKIKAEDGQGGEAEIELDAVNEIVKVLTGELIVLPDPGSSSQTEIDEFEVRMRDAIESLTRHTRTADGGEIAAELPTGEEVKVHMDALNEIIRAIATGGLVVLPNPGSDETATLDEEKLLIERINESVLEIRRHLDGGTIQAELPNGNSVATEYDATNEVYRVIAGSGVRVLPTDGADEQAELDEERVKWEKFNESLLEMARSAEGGTIRSEVPNGNKTEVEFDAENELIRAIAAEGLRVTNDQASAEEAEIDESSAAWRNFSESLLKMARTGNGGTITAEDLAGGGGIVELELDAVNNEILDNADTRIQSNDDAQFIRGLVGTEVVMQSSSPSNGAMQPVAVHFQPDVANPQLFVDAWLAKPGGSFKIDHPLDPDNKYLYHSFVESPDMMNVYNGNITTGNNGEATVQMPSYFSALNKDFRYQLTVIGTFSQAIVLEEIEGNSFKIKTDQPNVKVSWQVTGVRNDEFAKARRMQVEVEKEEEMKGKRLFEAKY